MTERLHAWVSGRVQGVWFRASTRKEALRLGLSGWVRNLPDGRVEWLAEGEQQVLEQLLAWSAQGPPYARVDSVKSRWSPAEGDLEGFEIG